MEKQTTRLTKTDAIKKIRAIPGMSARLLQEGEIRVRLNSCPDADYFTNDAQDALATAESMVLHSSKGFENA